MAELNRQNQGERVSLLQRDLVTLGYALPRWGVDGHLGDETFAAVARFEEDHGLPHGPPDTVLSATEQRIHEMAGALAEQPSPVIDETGKHPGKARVRARTWSTITGITLHQTACVLGETATRWHGVPVHIGVTAGGKILLLNPLSCVVYHGNGFNSGDVGIEIDGRFEGIEGNPKTFWRPPSQPDLAPMQPTAAQLDATREAIRWICAEVARHGGRVRFIHAHRMASASRQSDPGSRIWREVAMWARQALDLDDQGAGFTIGSGLPIPEAWDPARQGIKY